MKAFLLSVVVGIGIAIGASYILNETFQVDSPTAFTTEGARVGEPGDNLINY